MYHIMEEASGAIYAHTDNPEEAIEDAKSRQGKYLVVDDEDNIAGFLDLSNLGLGDKMFDYCWLLWSFEYNLKTDHYNDLLLKELGITIGQDDYERYVVAIHNND